MEEVDQIEMETKIEEAKQAPKVPNGALQNETSSPDSGHPSSRNFSITSGLSDGSFSTEDSSAPDANHRAAAGPQVSQSSIKAAGGESESLTQGLEEKDKGMEENKALYATKTAENTMTDMIDENINKKQDHLLPETHENAESETIKTDGTNENSRSVKTAAAKSKGYVTEQHFPKQVAQNIEEASKLEETNMKKIKENDKSKVSEMRWEDKIFKDTGTPEVEQNLSLTTDRVFQATGTFCASQRDETQAMTDSDESPSAIEMEEIPKAKVSMVPWSKKGHCETLSSSEDSSPHLELGEKEANLSPEATASILLDPKMESLCPPFDSLATSESTMDGVTSQELSGSPYSVRTLFFTDSTHL